MRAPILIVALCAAAFLGCQRDPTAPVPPPPAPRILEFSTSAAEVEPGHTVTLSWRTQDASSIELRDGLKGAVSGVDGAQTSGKVDVSVDEDTVFILTATNARSVRESAVVTVRAVGRAHVVFAASPTRIAAGESAVLAWTAAGARELSLRDSAGNSIDVEGQLATGSVSVSPRATTSYVLSVDGAEYTVEVEVRPTLGELVATPNWATPGEPVTLSWKTLGARKISLVLLGQGEVHAETDPARVADGSYEYAVPADLDPAAVLTFQLLAVDEHDQAFALGNLELYAGGNPTVTEWKVPPYAKAGGNFTVSWKTTGADLVEILEDGTPIFRSPVDAVVAASGSYPIVTRDADHTYQLKALRQRGGESLSAGQKVSPVGTPTVAANGFTATPQPGVVNAGEPVTLAWNVPNARNLKIVATNQYDVTAVTGVAAETGTATVYPNVNTEYVLTADNMVGDSVTVRANVTVGSSAKLVFTPPNAPNGSIVTVTSYGVPNGAQIVGLPSAVKNAPGEAFVDISATGISANHPGLDAAAQLVTLPEVFNTKLFGQPVSGDKLTVSMNGWFKFSSSAIAGPDLPTPFPTTALEPNAIAPFWADLTTVTGSNWSIKTLLATVGTERRLIVQWTKVKVEPLAGSEVSFQAQVYSSGKVVFAYQTLTNVAGVSAAIGVVNATESSAVVVPEVPMSGTTWTLFGPVTLPAQMTVVTTPFRTRVVMPQDHFLELETTNPALPAGQFKVSEVNARPATGATNGQWFELENATSTAIPLEGWTIDLGGGNTHQIAGVATLPANGRLVFGQSSTAGDGVPVNYVYGSALTLPAGGAVTVKVPGNNYVSLAIPAGLQQGRSWQTGPVAAGMTSVSGTTALECALSAPYGTRGQYGTPGAANPPCPGYLAPSSITSNFEPIAAFGTRICTANADYSIEAITPAVPFNVGRVTTPTVYVNSNGFITAAALTCPTDSCFDVNKSFPNTSQAPFGTIAPFWDDLHAHVANAGVYWASRDPDGTPGNGDEYTIISWENVTRRVPGTDLLNFQVKFFANGNVEFHYGSMSEHGSGATTWFEEPGGRATWLVNANSTTAPGIASNSAIRFTLQ